MKNLLGVDVGTTSLKMTLFDECGAVLQSVTQDYLLEASGDRVEFEPERYWQIFSEALAQIAGEFEISAMAIDTQCETLIVADEKGNPLRKAIVWLDNRATQEAHEIEAHFGRQRIYEVTGQPEVTATWPACKLLWLRKNEPEVFAKVKKVFLLEDYLIYRLTGEFVTEKTLQSSTIYLDINKGIWWEEMLNYIGVDSKALPMLRNSGEKIGESQGIAVVLSAMDQVAGAIGAGVVCNGVVSEMTGTTMVIFVPCDQVPAYRPDSKIPCHLNYNGQYCLLSWTPTAGIALKWFKNNFCEGFDFKQLDAMAERISPGCDGLTFLPYLCGSVIPRYNPDARGAFLGLTMEHTRAHAVRSILEAVACMLKENLDYMGISCGEIRSMGGGATSDLWCQIKADLTGKRIVTLKNPEAACLGSAILAGAATGVYDSVESACKALVKTDKAYFPQDVGYEKVYQRFCALEDQFL